MSKKRLLTESELDLWRRFTANVRPLAETDRNASLEAPPAVDPLARKNGGKLPRTAAQHASFPASTPSRPRTGRALDPDGPIDIDRKSWARLKRGRLAIDKTLDLHGRSQFEAHAALNRFLSMASAAGCRCVLVVTGKGGVDGRGVLRQMVPRWLDEADNRQKVLTYSRAQPRHGGDGAFYVLLRRQRQRYTP